ncbi:zf-CCHC domain-containing protein [Tanacetum coccineum]
MMSKNDEAKMVLYNALPKKEYERIFMCNTAKDVWNLLIITHQGNKQVKDNKIDLFVQKYEEFVISDDETIDCAFARFNTIITSLKALDESFSSRNHVRKFLRALPTKWHPKDSEISKVKKGKYKSLALKARKVLSDEEISCSESDDEEYAMAVRDFKKFFKRRGTFVRQPHDDKKNFLKIKEDKKEKEDRRCFKCGDPNHFISDCPKHSYNDQKAFVVGCWSDSNDSKKEEICLMALDNNEVRIKVKLEPDEWIKDNGCSRHMTGNKDLFSSYKAIDGGKTPYELFKGKKPSLEYSKVFGSKCFILNTKDYLTKFDPKSTEGIFLGYSPNSKAYVILNKETMRVEESLNVRFDESPPPKSSPIVDDDIIESQIIENQIEDIEIKENEPLNKEILNIKETKDHPIDSVIVIMEYLVKISKKARILELKRRNMKVTVLTSYTSYPSRKIWRICACTSQETTKIQDQYAVSRRNLYAVFNFKVIKYSR